MTDKGVVGAGLLDRVPVNGGVIFDRVRPNPDIELVGEASAVYREEGCDGLVAIGGGSPMDTAKGVGVEIEHGGSILDYEYGQQADHEAHPAADRDPDHVRHRQRGDALVGDHRPRPADQVQRRRDAADLARTSP